MVIHELRVKDPTGREVFLSRTNEASPDHVEYAERNAMRVLRATPGGTLTHNIDPHGEVCPMERHDGDQGGEAG